MAMFDQRALDRLRAEPLSGLDKGLPTDAAGLSVSDLAAQRRSLLDDGFTGPVLTIDQAALQHNIRSMADWCSTEGVELAPHGKTTMAPSVFTEQLAAGAWGLTVATVSQARVCVAFGITPVLIANQVVDEAGLRWIGERVAAGDRILFWVDSIAGVQVADRMLRDSGVEVEVLLEYGTTGGRGGCRTVDDAIDVAQAVTASRHLRLAGIAGYEGVLPAGRIDAYLQAMVDVATGLAATGVFDHLDQLIITAGGSSWFDRVAAILTTAPLPARVILRSGCYVTHDDGVYADSTPSLRSGDAPRLRPALRIWGQVSSRPEPDLLLVTLGRRDTSYDDRLPIPLTLRSRAGGRTEPFTAQVTALNDQHAYLSGGVADVGDWIAFGVSHPCTALERWRVIPVVEDGVVVDLAHTFF
ncbi:alanine racemase [Kribbella sp. NPDC050459]|uniref:alanine racemase n=1 Tax=Kribbella sp. NPDC050459 TaxID=3155785 RepID=UPI0033CAC447